MIGVRWRPSILRKILLPSIVVLLLMMQNLLFQKRSVKCSVLLAKISTDSRRSIEDPSIELPPGIQPRAFASWANRTNHAPLPCFPPGNNWWRLREGTRPTRQGIFYSKIYKTGSSTGAGVTLRMAYSIAQRHHNEQTNTNFKVCKNRFHHGDARRMKHYLRDKNQSFLWTMVRDPTSRAVSEFFHLHVARQSVEPTDENFIHFLNRTKQLRNKEVNYLMLQKSQKGLKEAIHQILNEFDFIGVTERADESVVAMQMLLGLETADVMYVSSAKTSGGYDDGRQDETCFLIPKAVRSQRVEEYLQSNAWKAIVHWDEILHEAANRSLDMTIERLGAIEFQEKLQAFRRTKKEVADYCADKVTFPCSSTGVYTSDGETDCYFGDYGCGFKCLDEYFSRQPSELNSTAKRSS